MCSKKHLHSNLVDYTTRSATRPMLFEFKTCYCLLILKEIALSFRYCRGVVANSTQLLFTDPPKTFYAGAPPILATVCSSPSKMEALGGYPTKSSNPKAKKLTVLLSMTVGVGCLFLLQTQLAKPRKPTDFYSFEVKDAKGRTVSLEKFRGKVSPHHHQSCQFEKKSMQRLS